MGPLRWGILGTGFIARTFARDLLLAGLSVTAVGSRSEEAARAFSSALGAQEVTAHGSYSALVNDPRVDIVYVATPHPMHAEHAALALTAGKHVLLEKPFTMNAREARAVVELAGRHGLLVQEAMWTRFLPHMAYVRRIVSSGALGELRTVVADHGQRLPGDPDHRVNDPRLGGGALLDLGIYPLSLAWDLLGAPARIQADATFSTLGVDDQTSAVLSYDGGAQAVLHCAKTAASPTTATIVGVDARLEVDGIWYGPSTVRLVDATGAVLERFDGIGPGRGRGRGMHHQALAVEAALREGRTTTEDLPAEESVAIMETLDTIRALIGLRYPGEELSGDV